MAETDVVGRETPSMRMTSDPSFKGVSARAEPANTVPKTKIIVLKDNVFMGVLP
ncbi:hypothetical protein D3C87_1846260 [compost metagenome]